MISNNITSSGSRIPEAKTSEIKVPQRLVESSAVEVKTDTTATVEIVTPIAKEAMESPPDAKSVSVPKDRPEKSAEAVTKEKVREAVKNVRDFINKNQRSLDFEMAEESNRVIITVRDRQTNKVIRQIPPEDVVKLSDQIIAGELSNPEGVLFKDKA